jgi:hypothetical protein
VHGRFCEELVSGFTALSLADAFFAAIQSISCSISVRLSPWCDGVLSWRRRQVTKIPRDYAIILKL